MIFLVEYDRQAGQLVAFETFENDKQTTAEQKRLDLEIRNLRNQVIHEVVLLEAPTEDELRRTHRRYFERLEQLAVMPNEARAGAPRRTN